VQYAYSFTTSGSMNHSRLTSITYPNGRVITFNYASGLNDNISRLTSITDGATTLESYEYLGTGTVVKRGHAQPGVDLTFIKLSGESNGDAGDPYIGLDRFGRVVDQRWTTSGGTTKDRFQYGHDRDSNRLYKENLVDSTKSELYGYDGLNQITSFDRGTLNGTKDGISGSPSRTQDWDFDGLGNWESVTTDGGSAQTRTHNKQNELTAASGQTSPTYDNNGNQTKDFADRRFKFDGWNRLVEVQPPGGGSAIRVYEYDALGRRIQETASGTTTDFYYSSAWQVLEERVSGNAKVSYVWSPVYIDAMIARDRDTDANGSLDERLYAMHDANFNVTGLLNTSGTIVERPMYDAFGSPTFYDGSYSSISNSAYGWNYLHQGLRWDWTVGKIWNRRRDYDPEQGRFIENDPDGLAAGDRDLYRYEANDPGNKVDPSGKKYDIVSVDHKTKAIVIRMYIDFSGSVTAALAQRWANAIAAEWSGKGSCKGTSYILTVEVKWRIGAGLLDKDWHNKIKVSRNNRGVSNVVMDPKGSCDTGTWYDDGDPWTVQHEAGHLLGLQDYYTVTTTGGVRVTTPNPGFAGTIMANGGGRASTPAAGLGGQSFRDLMVCQILERKEAEDAAEQRRKKEIERRWDRR
jgi:RHS repeat-associated protein